MKFFLIFRRGYKNGENIFIFYFIFFVRLNMEENLTSLLEFIKKIENKDAFAKLQKGKINRLFFIFIIFYKKKKKIFFFSFSSNG